MTKRTKRGGRQKGSLNKTTSTVKQVVVDVFTKLQGDAKNNLMAFAKKNPVEFYKIAAKLIPTEIKGDVKVTKVNLIVKRTNNNAQSE